MKILTLYFSTTSPIEKFVTRTSAQFCATNIYGIHDWIVSMNEDNSYIVQYLGFGCGPNYYGGHNYDPNSIRNYSGSGIGTEIP